MKSKQKLAHLVPYQIPLQEDVLKVDNFARSGHRRNRVSTRRKSNEQHTLITAPRALEILMPDYWGENAGKLFDMSRWKRELRLHKYKLAAQDKIDALGHAFRTWREDLRNNARVEVVEPCRGNSPAQYRFKY